VCAKKAAAKIVQKQLTSSDPEKRKRLALIKLRDLFEEQLKAEEGVTYQFPENALPVEEITADEAFNKISNLAKQIYDNILLNGRIVLDVPLRTSSNIIYDELNDLLLLGEKTNRKTFHSLTNVEDLTMLIRVMDIVHKALSEHVHPTKREIFYNDVKLFQDQDNSDTSIEDLSTILHTIRNSTNVVASAKGAAIGRLRIKDQNDIIDLDKLGGGGWSINPMLDNVDIIESDAEFILVVEKDAAMIRLSEAKWWRDYPCIILTGKGAADIATRMFLRRLNKVLKLPTFCLVDSDPYGHYIYSVYLRGSKRLSYESPFLATPNMHLLGVLTSDLDKYRIPHDCRLEMNKADLKRCKEMMDEDFVKKNPKWLADLDLMMKLKEKAEIQALASYGFRYLIDEYLPTKIETADWI
jgi:meiotic recombination protein SPO11